MSTYRTGAALLLALLPLVRSQAQFTSAYHIAPGTLDPAIESYGLTYQDFVDAGYHNSTTSYPGVNLTAFSWWIYYCPPEAPAGSYCLGTSSGTFLPGGLDEYSFDSLGCYYDGTRRVYDNHTWVGFMNSQWSYYSQAPQVPWYNCFDNCTWADGYGYPLRYYHVYYDPNGMTGRKCIEACAAKGYNYAAPWNGHLCACDNYFNVSKTPGPGLALPDPFGGATCYLNSFLGCGGTQSEPPESCGGDTAYWVYKYNGTGHPTDSPHFSSLRSVSLASVSSSKSAFSASKASAASLVSSSKLAASVSRSNAASRVTSSRGVASTSLSSARSRVSSSRSAAGSSRSSAASSRQNSITSVSRSKSNAAASATSSKDAAVLSRASVNSVLAASRVSASLANAQSLSQSRSLASVSQSRSRFSASSSRASANANQSNSRSAASLSRALANSLASSSRLSASSSRASWDGFISSSKASASASRYSNSVTVASSKAAAQSSVSSYRSFVTSSKAAASASKASSLSAYNASVSSASAARAQSTTTTTTR